MDSLVRYMNRVDTTIDEPIVGMFVADGICNLFTGYEDVGLISWHTFEATKSHMDLLLENKRADAANYEFEPTLKFLDFPLTNDGWVFKMLNRDLSFSSDIQDAYAIHCKDSTSDQKYYWWVSELDAYVYSQFNIKDMAYEQHGDSLYVLFDDDPYVYRYDHLKSIGGDSQGRILLKKETATMKIETKHSSATSHKNPQWKYIYLDYDAPTEWKIMLYGKTDESSSSTVDIETWDENPGKSNDDFTQYNIIIFGDSLFNEQQLSFQNVSKKKDMFDILDINEVDGCYYGLFKDESTEAKEKNLEYDIYTIFKTAPLVSNGGKKTFNGVIQRLPYQIVNPRLYRTSDDLYSLYVVEQVQDGVDGDGKILYKPQLREISVPDSDLYEHRTIDLYGILREASRDENGRYGIDHNLVVKNLVMSSFKPGSGASSFFALTDQPEPFRRIFYTNDFKQVSLDKLDGD